MANHSDAIRNYGTPVHFDPGKLICDREHPLTKVLLIESGYATPGDHIHVDVGRLGIMFERGDTFGEYAMFEPRDRVLPPPLTLPEYPKHETHALPAFPPLSEDGEPAPPSYRPYPSSLRALTRVDAIALDKSAYLRALAHEPHLVDLLRSRIVVMEYLARVMGALRRESELRAVPGFEIAQMAKEGQAKFLSENEEATFVPGAWVYVAWGRVSVCGGAWSIGAGQIMHYGDTTQALKAVTDSWLISVVRPQSTQAAFAAQPGGAGPRVVLLWAGDDQVTPEVVSACTAHLAAIQQQEEGRPPQWQGGLLIVDGPTRATAAMQGAANAGVVVRFAPSANVASAIASVNTPVVYLDVSRCPQRFVLQTVAPLVRDVVLLGGSPADLPEPLRSRAVVPCAVVANRPDDGLRAFASTTGRFMSAAFTELAQEPERAYAVRYVPRCVRLSFADDAELPMLATTDLPTADRQSFERIARAIAKRRFGVALGGGGGWGYAHIALLDALEKRAIPIDAISGVSFGSLVGGYYSVRNLEYVHTLIPHWMQLLASQLAAAVLPPVLGWFLVKKLHTTFLEDLPVPFFPVSLNLQVGKEWAPPHGTVAFGVRASSSLPGLLSPAIAKGRRGVDGGYINNVPEGILHEEGLHCILASSVVQAPSPGPEPLLPLGWSINPIERSLDSIRGMGWLMKVADERDEGWARWRFEPFKKDLLKGIQAWQLWKGAEIQDRVRREAALVVDRAYREWRAHWPP